MTTEVFTARLRQHDDAVVIDLAGRIDRTVDEPLSEAYAEAATGGRPIVLNFERVTYINSTGIALIVGLLARARADSLIMTAYGLSDHYRHIFEITRLSDFLHLYDTEDTAISGTPA